MIEDVVTNALCDSNKYCYIVHNQLFLELMYYSLQMK